MEKQNNVFNPVDFAGMLYCIRNQTSSREMQIVNIDTTSNLDAIYMLSHHSLEGSANACISDNVDKNH